MKLVAFWVLSRSFVLSIFPNAIEIWGWGRLTVFSPSAISHWYRHDRESTPTQFAGPVNHAGDKSFIGLLNLYSCSLLPWTLPPFVGFIYLSRHYLLRNTKSESPNPRPPVHINAKRDIWLFTGSLWPASIIHSCCWKSDTSCCMVPCTPGL